MVADVFCTIAPPNTGKSAPCAAHEPAHEIAKLTV